MNTQLFLTSSFAGTQQLFKNFVAELKDKRVLFIPTASTVEEYTGYVKDALSVFQELGFEVQILDIAKANQENIIALLESFPCLYISGGNTFYLLQELKKKNLIEIIRESINQGLIYVGESAGAIISSQDIRYVEAMDDKNKAPELSASSALALVDFYIVPHYKEFPFVESAEKIIEEYNTTLKLLPINNHQAIIVNNQQYQIHNEK